MHGDDAEAHVHRGVHAAHGAGHGGERTGQDVDHQHGQDVFIGGAAGENRELLIDGALALEEGQQHRKEHGSNRGELIEGHLYILELEIQTSPQVDDDKQQEREQRGAFALFLQSFHIRTSLCALSSFHTPLFV